MIDTAIIAVCVRELEKTSTAHVDLLSGGEADRLQPRDFNKGSLRSGTTHGMEHTRSRALAKEIAMDHLAEDPKYYKKLNKYVEKAASDEHPVSFVKGVRDFARNPADEARKGWAATRNDHPMQKKLLREELRDAKHPHHFKNDIETAKGTRAGLRRSGWLANYAKYTGPSTIRKGLNTVARHLTGSRALTAAGTVAGLHQALKKHDPTGRVRGVGERAGGAALGAAAGLAGMRHGFVGGAVLGMAGGATGRALGRQGDRLAGKAHELMTKRKAQK